MAYIGVQPTAGQYRKLDNISASFNGSTTSFTTSVGGTNVTAGTAQQLIVSLGGVIQQPDTDYTVSTNTITFTTAPTSGLDFFAILMGDALNTVTPSDGSVTTAKLAGSLSVGLAAGSVSAPSLFFTGDTNNGIYSPSTDAIAVTTAGSERLRVTSAGLVGIGTSSVNANVRLEVNGNISSNGDASPGGAGITIGDNQSGGYKWIQSFESHPLVLNPLGNNVGIGTTSPGTALHVNNSAGAAITQYLETSNSAVKLVFRNSTETGNNVQIGADGSRLVFVTGGTEKAAVDSSGRLLVGTSSARSNVYLGGGAITSNVQFEGSGSTYNTGLSLLQYSAAGYAPVFSLGASQSNTPGTNTRVTNGTDLGIINFVGNDGTNFLSGAYIQATIDGSTGTNDLPTRLVFSTTADGASSPTERMRLAQDGRFNLFNSGSATAIFQTASAAGTTNTIIAGRYNATNNNSGSDCFYVFSNGNVQNTNNSYTAISDIKLKENVVDAGSQWGDLKALRVRNYNLKEGQTHKQIGLIAQEVEPISPGLVYESPDRDTDGNDLGTVTKSVNYSVLYMKAVKALQEAMERIEQLEAEMAEVKAQLS